MVKKKSLSEVSSDLRAFRLQFLVVLVRSGECCLLLLPSSSVELWASSPLHVSTIIQGERYPRRVFDHSKFYITAITLKSTRRLFCGKRLRRKKFLVVISSSTYPSSSLGWGKRFRP